MAVYRSVVTSESERGYQWSSGERSHSSSLTRSESVDRRIELEPRRGRLREAGRHGGLIARVLGQRRAVARLGHEMALSRYANLRRSW
jgi:hypothetical protein